MPASDPDRGSRKRRIEREFGVPFPGEIRDEAEWTRTGLKSLPAGRIDWTALFGRNAPVVLDLGCGNGRFLIGSAVWRPDRNHLGVDILPLVIRYATRRANQRGLNNIRFAVSGGHELLAGHVAPASVSEIHCYHPQPYYEASEISKRLITPEFLLLVHRCLEPGGEFFLQTDNPGYWRYMREVVPVFFEFEERSRTWPDAPKGRTRREILALRRGLPVFRGHGRARRDLTPEQALARAAELPLPVFNADRALQALDDLERSDS
ncbi:MAG: methyltransferase domain-containing protein [Planctomycetaceae bacterium]|nr:methyltransferase domain-containing protein [Planctomycetaceae bacterium]